MSTDMNGGCANQESGLYANIILSMIAMLPLCQVGRIFSGRFENIEPRASVHSDKSTNTNKTDKCA